MTISRTIAFTVATLFLSSAAMAQTPATPPAAKTTTAAPMAKTTAPMVPEKKAEKPRTAASLECSKQADTKNVHGKERKKFMSECKKAAGKT